MTLLSDLDTSFGQNALQLDAIETQFKNAVAGREWEHEWSQCFSSTRKEFLNLRSILKERDDGNYQLAFSSLRGVLENLLFFRLFIEGKKYYSYQKINILPKVNPNPQARDITFTKWKNEFEIWQKTKDQKFKNYKDIIGMRLIGTDSIEITRVLEGLYDSKDVAQTGEWIPFYYFLFGEYNPVTGFVSNLPSVIEGDFFPDIAHTNAGKQKEIYRRYFTFNAMIKHWMLNNFIDKSQESRIRVHYNFLSLFVHPNVFQNEYCRLKYDSLLRKEVLEYESDNTMKVLISLYCVKIQETFLSTLANRMCAISGGNWVELLLLDLKTNSAVADILWFVFDPPTDFDIRRSESINLQKGLNKNASLIYYSNPLQRLRSMGIH